MIPKIIHYCWFGGAEIPLEYQKYIAEWQELHPEWEIKRWDELNFPLDNTYIKNAIESSHWANASNYARLRLLELYGGVYLDTDVKLLKPLDALLNDKCFIGFEEGEADNNTFWVNNAVMGSVASHSLISRCAAKIVSDFDGTERANESAPKLVTKLLIEEYGLKNYGRQQLSDGIKLYNKEVFYPIPWNYAKNVRNYEQFLYSDTLAVHMWGRTWFSREMMLDMIDNLQEWSGEQQQLITDLKAKIEQGQIVEAAINQLQNNLSADNNKVFTTLQEQHTLICASLQKFNEVYTSQNEETSLLHQTLHNRQEEISLLHQKLYDRQEEISLLHQKLHSRQDEISLLSQKLHAQQGEISLLHQKLYDKQKEISLQDQKLHDRQEEMDTCQSHLSQALSTIDSKENDIQWYRRTYEQRSLIGILKQRITSYFRG